MKGIIFTEFLDFVEAQSGYETVDAILEEAAPPSGGAYTAVGNYHFSEMVSLVTVLSQQSKTPVPDLLRSFGRHLFGRFACIYPSFFKDRNDPFDFLQDIEQHIHAEVRKLYPDAELPHVTAERTGEDTLRVQYRSCRPFGDMCLGLIEGCGAHFGVEFDIQSEPAADGKDFTIRRLDAASRSEPRGIEAIS
jgi:hypothetical protein